MKARSASRAATALFLPFFSLTGAVHAHKEETQYWANQGVSTMVDDATTLAFDLSERFLDAPVARHQYLASIAIDRRIAPGVSIGGGVTWSQVGQVNEYRPFEQLTLTRGAMAARTRIEQRMFDNTDGAVWRLRERLQLAVPLDPARRWTGTLNVEGFFNLNRTNSSSTAGLTMVRTLVGIRRTLGRRLSLALSYQRQQTLVANGEDVVTHQPIMAFALKL
jgi:hypothetical protein